jgi:hypothetical protein
MLAVHLTTSGDKMVWTPNLNTEKQGQLQRTEVRMAAAPCFQSGVPHCSSATDLKWQESVFAEQAVQDEAQPALSLARYVSRNGEFGDQEDVKKLKNKFGVNSASKNVAPGCPLSDRWGGGIHFVSKQKSRNFSQIDFFTSSRRSNP